MPLKPRSRVKHKGRREGGTFAALPHAVMDSPNWRQCSGTSIKVLLHLLRQYNGKNNGDLCATLSLMKKRGMNSSDTLTEALKELCHYGFVAVTKHGIFPRPYLYALTWHAIDECGGKLEVPATKIPSGDWKQVRTRFKKRSKNKKTTPPAGVEPNREPEHAD